MSHTAKDPVVAAVTALLVGGALLALRIVQYLVGLVATVAYGQSGLYGFPVLQTLLEVLPFVLGFFLSLWLIAPITRELRLPQVIGRAAVATAVAAAVLFVVLIIAGIVTSFGWEGSLLGQAFPTTRFDGGGAVGGILRAFVTALNSVVSLLPLGVLAAKIKPSAQPILGAVGVIQTIPSLALLAFLITLLGTIGTLPALAALFLYALLPIVRNTYTGLAGIGAGMRQAALALGLSAQDRLRLIELPLAMPSVLGGIKISAVINVGTATIAAFIGAGGFGERIVTGLALNDRQLLLAGALPAAALALLSELVFEAIDRLLLRRPG